MGKRVYEGEVDDDDDEVYVGNLTASHEII